MQSCSKRQPRAEHPAVEGEARKLQAVPFQRTSEVSGIDRHIPNPRPDEKGSAHRGEQPRGPSSAEPRLPQRRNRQRKSSGGCEDGKQQIRRQLAAEHMKDGMHYCVSPFVPSSFRQMRRSSAEKKSEVVRAPERTTPVLSLL